MPFAINGRVLVNPATHKWVTPASYGTSLAGKPLFPGVLSYEMSWPMLSQSEFNLLVDEFGTGSVVVSLPQWRGFTSNIVEYDFESYTGAYLSMPEFQTFFDGYYNNVKVLINNVAI